MIYGLDVSAYQAHPDWAAVKAAGKDFCIFKYSEGLHYLSPVIRQQIEGTAKPGIICAMIYHFAKLSEDPVEQGRILGRGSRELGIRAALDVETQPAGLSMADTRSWMAKALDACEQETGQSCVLYSFYSYLEALTLPSYWAERDLWLALYPLVPTPAKPPKLPHPWTKYTIWQYGGDANKATCPGIQGYADLNVWPGTLEELGVWIGVSPMASTEPPPVPDSSPTGR